MRPSWRAAALAAACASLAACTYFNGVYNAHHAASQADGAMRHGRTAEAQGAYISAATKAESLLMHHGRGKWHDDALYIAGRSWALAGECVRGTRRLQEFLVLPAAPADRRRNAELALGICYVRDGKSEIARQVLDSLLHAPERDIVSQAALWSARAALALGDDSTARTLLAHADPVTAQWELADVYLQQQKYAPAESLLVLRAAAGDYRPDMLDHLTELFRARRLEGVERIVQKYDRSRLGGEERATLNLTIGRLELSGRSDTLARAHFQSVLRVTRDTLTEAAAATELTTLSLGPLSSLQDVQGAIQASRRRAGKSPAQLRLEDNLLLVKILIDRGDYAGAGLFLAGEVARDSLHAYALAHQLFRQVVTTAPTAPLAPRALLAAAALMPESAAVYRTYLQNAYGGSPYTALIERGDSAASGVFREADESLDQLWTVAVKLQSDSVVRMRPSAARTTAGTPAGVTVGGVTGTPAASPGGAAGTAGTTGLPSSTESPTTGTPATEPPPGTPPGAVPPPPPPPPPPAPPPPSTESRVSSP